MTSRQVEGDYKNSTKASTVVFIASLTSMLFQVHFVRQRVFGARIRGASRASSAQPETGPDEGGAQRSNSKEQISGR